MEKFFNFIKESYGELVNKVTWPKYGELQNSSVLVLVASLIFAVVVAVIDFAFKNGLTMLYNTF